MCSWSLGFAPVSKETYYIGKRDLLYRQKSIGKRDLLTLAYLRSAPVSKETYYIGKRDLVYRQKRPGLELELAAELGCILLACAHL